LMSGLGDDSVDRGDDPRQGGGPPERRFGRRRDYARPPRGDLWPERAAQATLLQRWAPGPIFPGDGPAPRRLRHWRRGPGDFPSFRPARRGGRLVSCSLRRVLRRISVMAAPIPFLRFARIAAGDLTPLPAREHDADVHLSAAVDWLCRAQDIGPDDGVSYGFSLRGGWRPSYIETTGYITCTFFNLAHAFSRDEYRGRAIRMARWLRSVQNTDGSFSNPRYAPGRGIVFDTGQDLFGLVRAYQETGEEALLDSARRAGDWLVEVADPHGRWTRNTHLDVPHVYNSRVAWALLELHGVDPRPGYERVARANLDWAASRQRDNGWFDDVGFERGVAPFTHTIAYA